MADVVLQPAGKTTDGKPLFDVIQIAEVPEEVMVGKKGDKHNTSDIVMDEFYVARPKRSWVLDMYGSIADSLRRR